MGFEKIIGYANALFTLAINILNLFADEQTQEEAAEAKGKYDDIVGYINEFMTAIK